MDDFIRPLIDDARIILAGLEDAESAFAQRLISLTQSDHHAVEIIQLPVLFLFIPFHAFAAVGVLLARESDLIAVVNARCPHEGEEEDDGELQPAFILPDNRQKTWGVMAAQQIKDDLVRLLRIAHQ
ncbi:hypothetical protein D3C81_1530630 [compost metagenome]